jgi:low temperature requirement protein LtrA
VGRLSRVAMRARSIDEPHRVSTSLELFFDLCFVVGVAQAANGLHHALTQGHAEHAVVGYASVFFAVWWAWMNFTWFASAYDADDVLYRVTTFVQITGVLILAAGVPRAFDNADFAVVTLGYVVMRVALVGHWLRAAANDPAGRRTALRFAIGVSGCMVGWGLLLLVPSSLHGAGFAVMVLAELAVPLWAEMAGRTAWHPHHIAERYGLFTLIVLGESVFAATLAIQSALDQSTTAKADLLDLLIGAPLVVFGMWWIYFAKPAAAFLVRGNRIGFLWGYGHIAVFASAAAVGAGLAVGVDHATHHGRLSSASAAAAVTVPIAAYVVTVWALHLRPHHLRASQTAAALATAAVVLASTFTRVPVVISGLALAAMVAFGLVTEPTAESESVGTDRPADATS